MDSREEKKVDDWAPHIKYSDQERQDLAKRVF